MGKAQYLLPWLILYMKKNISHHRTSNWGRGIFSNFFYIYNHFARDCYAPTILLYQKNPEFTKVNWFSIGSSLTLIPGKTAFLYPMTIWLSSLLLSVRSLESKITFSIWSKLNKTLKKNPRNRNEIKNVYTAVKARYLYQAESLRYLVATFGVYMYILIIVQQLTLFCC